MVYSGYYYSSSSIVTVKSSTATFRGFLVIAHVPGEDHMLLGSFTPQNGSQQTVNCSFTGASNEVASTIAHNNSAKLDFQSITTKWTAPSGKDGMVDFRCVVLLTRLLYRSRCPCTHTIHNIIMHALQCMQLVAIVLYRVQRDITTTLVLMQALPCTVSTLHM